MRHKVDMDLLEENNINMFAIFYLAILRQDFGLQINWKKSKVGPNGHWKTASHPLASHYTLNSLLKVTIFHSRKNFCPDKFIKCSRDLLAASSLSYMQSFQRYILICDVFRRAWWASYDRHARAAALYSFCESQKFNPWSTMLYRPTTVLRWHPVTDELPRSIQLENASFSEWI